MEPEPERPPPRALLPPHRERQWTAEAHRRLLQGELLDVPLYRKLVSADEDVTELLATLEDELDAFVADPSPDAETPTCLRFPPLPGRVRFLIAKCAERYHLQPVTFGQEERRFTAVYKHPRACAPPVLRLSDFAHATSYYTPAAPPQAAYAPRAPMFAGRADAPIELDAAEVPPRHDYARWAVPAASSAAAEPAHGFECEVAGCHEHMLELRFGSDAPLPTAERCAIAEAVAMRALPAGYVAVFRSAAAAKEFVNAHACSPPERQRTGGGEREGYVQLELPLDGEICAVMARPLSALHERRRVLGGGGAPRALTAALRGLGGRAAGQNTRVR